MESLVRQLIADFQEMSLPSLVPRTAHVPDIPGKANVVTGARRSGKTYFLYQLMDDLLSAGTPKSSLLYLNFEDERLGDLTIEQMHVVTDVFFRLFPENRQQLSWLFFDEIQNVSGWERYVRRLLDTENVRIFLTGSSSKLLSREIATSMRGRAIETRLLPFGFAEVLAEQQTAVPARLDLVGKGLRSTLENRLEKYLEVGGFPEVLHLNSFDRRQVLQDYVGVAMFRDVVQRHGVTNITLLKRLVRQILGSPACAFSANKFHRDSKSQGLSCAKNTILDYLEHLLDCFLVFRVELLSESERRRQTNPTKLYPVDPGLAAAFRMPGREPQGHLLETVVLLELLRRQCDVAYHHTGDGHEVDFHARSPTGEVELIQVCADVSSADTLDRELRALKTAAQELGQQSATIVSMTHEDEHVVDGRRIRVIPAWQWLLDKPEATPP